MPTVRVAAVRALSAALIAGAIALPLVGGGDDAPAARPAALEATEMQDFRCADWQRADLRVRRNVIYTLRAITGGQVTGGGVAGRGTVLRDGDAFRLFDAHCKQPHARYFVLYKLYGQAAGFAGVAP